MSLTDFLCITQIGVIRQIQKDQKECDDVNDEAKNNYRVAANFVCYSIPHQTKRNTSKHLPNTNKYSGKTDKLLCWLADSLGKSNAGWINTAKEWQL